MGELSDAQVLNFVKSNGLTDASALLRLDTHLEMNGPTGAIGRIAITTAEGIANTPEGLLNAAIYDFHHPMEIVKTVAGSAALAAGLKVILPEAGPVGKIAGLAMGAWFVAGAAPAFVNAYKTGLNAEGWGQLHLAGKEWGNAAGQLGVNSALGMVGYKLGAGISGNILARESFDNFADFKQNTWDKATDITNRILNPELQLAPAATRNGFKPNFSLEGDKAKLVDSTQLAPSPNNLGPADVNAEMNATIMLQSKASLLKMDRYIARMSTGSAKALTDDGNAFAEKFGASQESLDAVTEFAKKNNLTVAESDLRSGRVFLDGKIGDFQKAFGVQLSQYKTNGGISIGHTGPVSIPTELTSSVRAVLGVDERPVATPNYRIQTFDDTSANTNTKPGSEVSTQDFLKKGGYLATDIAKAQNIPLKTGGEGQNGAFISLDGGIDLADYNKFFPERGLEQPKPLGIIEVGGAKNRPGVPANGDIENALDAVQMQTVAPKAKIDMILGNNTDQGLVDAFERGIFPKNGEAQKTVISASWGLAEQKQTPQAVNSLSILFREAAIRGVQIVSGSGDSGARSHSTTFQPEYPASDPNVTGVGGLKMVLNPNGTLKDAIAWDEGEGSSSGGGVSKIFKMPWWQEKSGVPNNPDTGQIGRGVPDISTNAARATGFPVRVGGQDLVIGGTSAGAPLYAGMLLNLNAELAAVGLKPITPLNPWLYTRANSGIFNDVTEGGNHGFKAGKGWNAVTGLGWVDGQAMLDGMKSSQIARTDPGIGMMLSIFPDGFNFTGDPQRIAGK